METFIIYFLKANLVLAVLYSAFWLMLKGEKFFHLNRALILSIIFLSLVLPVAPSPESFNNNTNTFQYTDYGEVIGFANKIGASINSFNASQNNHLELPATQTIPAKEISLTSIIFYAYLLISAVLLLRFVAQLLRVRKILGDSKKRKYGDMTVYLSKAEVTPFSFFNYLVINDNRYNSSQMAQILEHEKVHIKQWHSLDILFAEIFHIFFWINPIVRVLKQNLRLNLEYIADHEVINSGVDSKSYQLNILQSCLNPITIPLTNLFTSSKIKQRIKMMNTKKHHVQDV